MSLNSERERCSETHEFTLAMNLKIFKMSEIEEFQTESCSSLFVARAFCLYLVKNACT